MSSENAKKRSINDEPALQQGKQKKKAAAADEPLIFGQLVSKYSNIEYAGDDKTTVSSCHKGTSLALGNTVMSSGKHYVTFERSNCEYDQIYVGVMRPVDGLSKKDEAFSPIFEKYDDLLQKNPGRWGDGNVHTCMTELTKGVRSTNGLWSDGTGNTWNTKKNQRELRPDWGEWEHQTNCTLGMLLDMDEGTLSLYEVLKSGKTKKKGVLKDGLTGEYCWVVEITDIADGCSVQMKRGVIPTN